MGRLKFKICKGVFCNVLLYVFVTVIVSEKLSLFLETFGENETLGPKTNIVSEET